jgi:hypothetical protein
MRLKEAAAQVRDALAHEISEAVRRGDIEEASRLCKQPAFDYLSRLASDGPQASQPRAPEPLV